MYFSSLVKQELAQIRPQDRLEQKGELMAFVLLNGHIDKKERPAFHKYREPCYD